MQTKPRPYPLNKPLTTPPELQPQTKQLSVMQCVLHYHVTSHGTQLCCGVLQHVAACCSALWCVAACCSVLQCVLQHHVVSCDTGCILTTWNFCCDVLQRAAVCCSVLQCAAVFCSVLQCFAVFCSVLQCFAVFCNVLQCVAVCVADDLVHIFEHKNDCVQCVAVCCSLLQCVTVCFSVLQCVAVCCRVCCRRPCAYLGA